MVAEFSLDMIAVPELLLQWGVMERQPPPALLFHKNIYPTVDYRLQLIVQSRYIHNHRQHQDSYLSKPETVMLASALAHS